MLWSMMRLIFKTSSVTPDFFYVFNLILSFSTCSESFEKICAWEFLGANVLKGVEWPVLTLGCTKGGGGGVDVTLTPQKKRQFTPRWLKICSCFFILCGNFDLSIACPSFMKLPWQPSTFV